MIRPASALLSLGVLLQGCSTHGQFQGSSVPHNDDDDTTSGDDDAIGDDDAVGDDDTVEQVLGAEDDAAYLFSLEQVHHVEIELPQESLQSLYGWPDEFTYDLPYDYVSGDVQIDGELVEDVAVRLKGRWGSYRGMGAKAAFKIDFNRFAPDQTFHGLEKLTLNNMVVDCAMAREVLALDVYRARGLVTPRAGYAWVTVNGEAYGVYSMIETLDDAFLRAHFAEPGGNLYEPEYVVYPDYSYSLVDFDQATQHYFALEEGQDVGLADVMAVTDALDEYEGSAHLYTEVDQVLELQQWVRLFSVEQWVGQNDGYALNTNNYFVYFDPTDGRGEMLPWDLDYSFLYASEWSFDWRQPRGRVASACFEDVTCFSTYLDEVEITCQTADDLDLGARLDEIEALIAPYLANDPRQECPEHWVDYYRDVLREWFWVRTDEVRWTWGL